MFGAFCRHYTRGEIFFVSMINCFYNLPLAKHNSHNFLSRNL